GTEDHYQVTVETASFQGLTRIQQHKAVMAIFDAELKSGEIHALTIKTITR
ncbi:MAG TPA: BolA family protein, partial [Bdellovibrionales bacterium]|nr:BolA family protein [Bdellovibrionales bacterium]